MWLLHTLRGIFQHQGTTASGLHVVGMPWWGCSQPGEALGWLGMPLVSPPHGMVLIKLMLYCACQFNTFLPVPHINNA